MSREAGGLATWVALCVVVVVILCHAERFDAYNATDQACYLASAATYPAAP